MDIGYPRDTSPRARKLADHPRQKAEASQDDASTSTTRLVNPFKRAGILQDLPLTIAGKQFMIIPDTGSAVNAKDYETLRTLHSDEVIVMEDDVDHPESFRLGDSSMTAAIGQIELPCWFSDKADQQQSVIFMVFDRLADGVQAILGAPFLNINQIYTHLFHLSIPRRRLDIAIPRILRLNCSRLQMNIHLESEVAIAFPDTGSELDLISMEYARKRNFKVMELGKRDETRAQLANGRVIDLTGKVIITVAMPEAESITKHGNLIKDDLNSYAGEAATDGAVLLKVTTSLHDDPPDASEAKTGQLSSKRTFYVFRELDCDVLLSQSLLHSMDAFRSHRDAFIEPCTASNDREIDAILKLSHWQRRWCDFRDRMQSTSSDPNERLPGKGTMFSLFPWLTRTDSPQLPRRNTAECLTSSTNAKFPEGIGLSLRSPTVSAGVLKSEITFAERSSSTRCKSLRTDTPHCRLNIRMSVPIL